MPRKKIVLTPEQQEMLVRGASIGLTQKQLAFLVGCHEDTLPDLLKRSPGLEVRYQQARLLNLTEVAESLYTQAKSGNVVAAIFILKSQLGWRDVPETAIADTGQIAILQFPPNGRDRGGTPPN